MSCIYYLKKYIKNFKIKKKKKRIFVLAFNANNNRQGHSTYHLSTAKVKEYNVTTDEKNFVINKLKIL